MIGELASAIPKEGGFYVWVRRALGPFWAYQEGWFSLSASIFDMAIYPVIFVLYLGKFTLRSPPAGTRLCLVAGRRRWCAACWNLRGAPAWAKINLDVCVLLAPFVSSWALCVWRALRCIQPSMWGGNGSGAGLSTAILVAIGITTAGTMPPPWPRKSKIRSATILAP